MTSQSLSNFCIEHQVSSSVKFDYDCDVIFLFKMCIGHIGNQGILWPGCLNQKLVTDGPLFFYRRVTFLSAKQREIF